MMWSPRFNYFQISMKMSKNKEEVVKTLIDSNQSTQAPYYDTSRGFRTINLLKRVIYVGHLLTHKYITSVLPYTISSLDLYFKSEPTFSSTVTITSSRLMPHKIKPRTLSMYDTL